MHTPLQQEDQRGWSEHRPVHLARVSTAHSKVNLRLARQSRKPRLGAPPPRIQALSQPLPARSVLSFSPGHALRSSPRLGWTQEALSPPGIAPSSWAGVWALSLRVPGVCKTSRGPGRPAHFLPHGADITQTRLSPATWGAVCGRPSAGPGRPAAGQLGDRDAGPQGLLPPHALPGMGWPPSCPLTSGHRGGPEILGPRLWGLARLPGVDGGPVSREALPRALQGRGPWKWATTCGPQGAQGLHLPLPGRPVPPRGQLRTPSQGA